MQWTRWRVDDLRHRMLFEPSKIVFSILMPAFMMESIIFLRPTQREETEQVIKTALKEIMMSVDLDEVTSKYIRSRLEEHLKLDLGEFKSFIDQEMIIILGQMDAPTEIFEHVYLGSEWNASNLEELQRNG